MEISVDEAAAHIAFSRTGLKNLFLQQFRAFGTPTRAVDKGFTPARILEVTGIIIKTKETRRIGAHRSPFLYQFDIAKYRQGLKTGVELVF